MGLLRAPLHEVAVSGFRKPPVASVSRSFAFQKTEQQPVNEMGLLRAPFHKAALAAFRKPTVASIESHTMGSSLFRYLDMKVHQDIKEKQWSQMVVEGQHSRTPPARVCAMEKKDEPFNWQRPTTNGSGQ